MTEGLSNAPDLSRIQYLGDDTVVLKSIPSLVGSVRQTYNNPDPIKPLEEDLIISHVPVPSAALKQFLASGHPPKGYIYVEWAREEWGNSLVAEEDVILVNRSFSIGETVKSHASDQMVGTIVNIFDRYILEPIISMTAQELNFTHQFYPSTGLVGECDSTCPPQLPPEISHSHPHNLLYNIPGEELKRAQDFELRDYLMFQDWLGVIDEVNVDVVLSVGGGNLVVVNTAYELELIIPDLDKPLVTLPELDGLKRPDVLATHRNGVTSLPNARHLRGQYVITNRRNLRLGRWLEGSYRDDLQPEGYILDVRARDVSVDWLCPNAFAPDGIGESTPQSLLRPYENLHTFHMPRDLRRNKNVTLFDHGRRPNRGMNSRSSPPICVDQRFGVGDRVKFRDQTGASLKYSGTGPNNHGRFDHIPKEHTFGYDLNEFQVVYCRQEVLVQWQDQHKTIAPSITLRPFDLPEAELCPGDIVTLKQGTQQFPIDQTQDSATEFNEMLYFQGDFILRPKKIGVVQSVDSKERLVNLRWFANPRVEFLEQGNVLRAGSTFGEISDTFEDLSIYEIMTHPALFRQRRDLVLLPPEHPSTEILSSLREHRTIGAAGPSILSYLSSSNTWERFQHIRSTAKFLINSTELFRNEAISKSANIQRPLDWVGQIVDIGLDGVMTVRLNGLSGSDCRDIKVPFERILMVIDEEDVDFGTDSTSLSMRDPWLGYSSEEAESEFDSAIDEEIEYEGGQRLDNESGDEDWMTDESMEDAKEDTPDEDKEMVDALDHQEPSNDQVTGPPILTNPNDQIEQSNFPLPVPDQRFSNDLNVSMLPLLSPFSGTVPPPTFSILESEPPDDQYGINEKPSVFPATFLRRLTREHRILSTSLPEHEIYVRTYESRLDLLRCLIIGPSDTPYEFAPFVIDLQLGPTYPKDPPIAHFHSWTGGLGRINPNLYEEGKICLSLLGTWRARTEGEGWSENATLLQILISLMGLVLVKQPFYNEAGFETFSEEKVYTLESQRYTEKVYVMARNFVKHALTSPVKGFEDILAYLYLNPNAAPSMPDTAQQHRNLLHKVITRSKAVIASCNRARNLSNSSNDNDESEALIDGGGLSIDPTKVFLKPLSRGAVVMLSKHINTLEQVEAAFSQAAVATKP